MQPGERIDHYRLVSMVGAGGMGEVYRAVDERLRRDVAIKVLPHTSAPAHREARLLREAQAASHLNHPGIVTIHDVGRWHDRTYIVMELVEGQRLSELVQSGLTPAQAVALCRQAAAAMAVAHERGILHRDIKPDNVMVTRDERVKILDFGVAKVFDGTASPDPDPDPEPEPIALPEPGAALDDTLLSPPRTPATISVTRTGALLGTPAYMSPEQASGVAVDQRSEVYSLGLVLYELLTGVRPLQRPTLIDTLSAARAPVIPPPSRAARGRSIPRGCDRLLMRALAPAPADRYPTMRALADDLRALEAELSPRRRRRRWLPVAVAGGLLASGGAALVLVSSDGSRRQQAVAPGGPAIEVTRVRRLTFEPGCEELPAFWPDGNSIVFDAIVDGDTELVRLDLATGARQRLTKNPGWDIGGSVSRDGRFIAFVRYGERGRELMVMPWSEHGPGEARSFGLVRGFPSWTADGRLLAGDALSGISRIDPTGQGVRETFASAPGYIAAEVEEMAGGEVVVGLRDTGREGLLELGRTRGGPVTLTGDSQILDSTGIESDAAGRGLYYGERTATGRRLYWRSLDGGQRHELENLPFAYGGIAADRGGRRLALSTCRQVFQTGRMKAGRFVPLLPPRDWSDGLIQPVGDGSFVFATDRSGPTEIWLARPGAAPRRLVAGATSPAVSRDGRLMAWVAIGDDRHRIYLGAIDGSSQRLLTDNASDDMPALSNDGSQIYFMRGSPEGMRVFRMPAEGGEPVPVTGGGVVAYSLSPADGRLAWVIDTPRGRQLALGEPGGRSQVVPALPPGNYTDVTFSADGATLWVGRGATEILELAADGRSSPKVVWHTTNDVVSHLAADEHGLLADVATYVGDIYLVEGHFR